MPFHTMPQGLKSIQAVAAVLVATVFFVPTLRAIDSTELLEWLPPGTTFNDKIPTPESHLGWSVGQRHAQHFELVSYAKLLSDLSDRLRWIPYGKTYGGKPLGIVFVSRPDRQSDDSAVAIRQARQQWLGDELTSNSDQSKAPSASDASSAMPPGVAWLGYSIHGDEASGSNAALLVLYMLAAAEGDWIDAVLDQHVLLVDPSLNPDGLDRFATWVNDHRSAHPSSDAADMEHQQVWPRGRTNHYNFDLNRDWLPATQPESLGRLQLYHDWLPNLVMDFHEMGTETSLFFQPGVEGRDHPLTPSYVREVTQKFAERYATMSDRANEAYFTQERFDDFYPGKGSTYPDLHGSIGILVEQGSTRGFQHDYEGGVRTFEDTVWNPFRLTIATLDALVENYRAMMQYQRDFYTTLRSAWLAKYPKGYLLQIPHDYRIQAEFREFARIHRIELKQLERSLSLNNQSFEPESWWFLPSDQRHGLFVHAIMDRTKSFPFDQFYDVSAWNMADAFGLSWQAVDSDIDASILIEDRVPELASESTKIDEQSVAIAIPGRDINTMTLMSEWLHEGWVIRTAELDARVIDTDRKSQALSAGSILLLKRDQTERWSELCRMAEAELPVRRLKHIAIASGLTEKGPDLGSLSFPRISPPRIAILAGEGTAATEAGSLWFTLDRLLSIPVTRIEPSQLDSTTLSRFNTLLIADGDSSRFAPNALVATQDWVRAGGRVLLLGGSVGLEKPLSGASSTIKVSDEKNESLSNKAILNSTNGVILESQFFGDHVLKKAYGDRKLAIYQSDAFWPIAGSTRMRLSDAPLLAGFLKSNDQGKIAGRAVMGVLSVGRGSITTMTFNPVFRGHYWGTIGLLREVLFAADK